MSYTLHYIPFNFFYKVGILEKYYIELNKLRNEIVTSKNVKNKLLFYLNFYFIRYAVHRVIINPCATLNSHNFRFTIHKN